MDQNLINQILSRPESVSKADINPLFTDDNQVSSEDLKELFLRIYDLNSTEELGGAHQGIMGRMNRRSNKRRNKKFFKRLKKSQNRDKIYIEGDSWFQHPLIRDLVDQIDRVSNKKLALYSSAMGGEWWLNIIERGEYIPEISKVKPDAVILSGAGNDIVGNKKLSNLVRPEKGHFAQFFQNTTIEDLASKVGSHPYLKQYVNINDDSLSTKQKEMLLYGFRVLSKDFYALIWAFELMYKYVIKNIHRKFSSAKIITQGYDYPIPSYKRGPWPKKFLINAFMNNGHWLADPLNMAGIPPKKQSHVTFALIYLFNEMLISITKESQFNTNLFHIDCRNVAEGKVSNWYDEMHLKPKKYKEIAETYINCINYSSKAPRVFTVSGD